MALTAIVLIVCMIGQIRVEALNGFAANEAGAMAHISGQLGAFVSADGMLALIAILLFSFGQDESSTRIFILAAALAGLPLAWWRARVSSRRAARVSLTPEV